MRKKTIVLSMKGTFYQTFGKDAVILHNLTGYKLVHRKHSDDMCGFPETAIGKIVSILKEKHVSYQICKTGPDHLPEIVSEQHFEDSAYEIYAGESKFDHAVSFIERLCMIMEQCRQEYAKGICMTLNLNDEGAYENFCTIRDYLKGEKHL